MTDSGIPSPLSAILITMVSIISGFFGQTPSVKIDRPMQDSTEK